VAIDDLRRDDWAKTHHDVYLMNDAGQRLPHDDYPKLAGIRACTN